MDTYSQGFYDLLGGALGGASTARLQTFIDATLAEKYNRLQLDGFEWDDDMQLDFTYEQLQKEVGITAMSNYYDIDAPAVPMGGEGFTLATGKIPRMKNVAYFNEDKLRKQLLFERLNINDPDGVVNNRRLKLFTTIDDLVQSHVNSLTYQRNQMVSAGQIAITDTNNPYGISGVTLYANVPSDNKTALSGISRWWTEADYSAEGSAADPVKCVREWIRPMQQRGIKGHIEVNYGYFQTILGHSKVLSSLSAVLFPLADPTQAAAATGNMGPDALKSAFEKAIGCSIKVVDSLVVVEKYDKDTKKLKRNTLDAFDSNVLVFVPDGVIGHVKAVLPITVDDPAASFGRFYGGRLLLTVSGDASKKCQSYETEMTALAVPEVPQHMYYLYPNNV